LPYAYHFFVSVCWHKIAIRHKIHARQCLHVSVENWNGVDIRWLSTHFTNMIAASIEWRTLIKCFVWKPWRDIWRLTKFYLKVLLPTSYFRNSHFRVLILHNTLTKFWLLRLPLAYLTSDFLFLTSYFWLPISDFRLLTSYFRLLLTSGFFKSLTSNFLLQKV